MCAWPKCYLAGAKGTVKKGAAFFGCLARKAMRGGVGLPPHLQMRLRCLASCIYINNCNRRTSVCACGRAFGWQCYHAASICIPVAKPCWAAGSRTSARLAFPCRLPACSPCTPPTHPPIPPPARPLPGGAAQAAGGRRGQRGCQAGEKGHKGRGHKGQEAARANGGSSSSSSAPRAAAAAAPYLWHCGGSR